MNTFKLGVGVGCLVGVMLGTVLGSRVCSRVCEKPPVAIEEEEAVRGTPLQSLEEENAQLELFISRLEQAEAAAEDWFREHGSSVDRHTYFLTEKGQKELSISVPDILHCTIDDPQKEFPQCNNHFFYFYEFGCDYQGCGYTFCRAGEVPYSCLYSGVGYLKADSRHWEHSIHIFTEELLPLGKSLYKTRQWEATDLL